MRYTGCGATVTSSTNAIENQLRSSAPPPVTDEVLVDRAAGGDESAFAALMQRYDRLVRYTVFRIGPARCRQDPSWLDTVAADTWVGFLRSVKRSGDIPDTLGAYLLRVARNQAVSALRSARRADERATRAVQVGPVTDVDPAQDLAVLEDLEALRLCLLRLPEDDRLIATQLSAILDRRWQEASRALGLPESTVRSRWKRTLEALRTCLRGKTGKNFAPPGGSGDD